VMDVNVDQVLDVLRGDRYARPDRWRAGAQFAFPLPRGEHAIGVRHRPPQPDDPERAGF
jgi:hypothetical protein